MAHDAPTIETHPETVLAESEKALQAVLADHECIREPMETVLRLLGEARTTLIAELVQTKMQQDAMKRKKFGIEEADFPETLSPACKAIEAALQDATLGGVALEANPKELMAMEMILKGRMKGVPGHGRMLLASLYQFVHAWGKPLGPHALAEESGYNLGSQKMAVQAMPSYTGLSRWHFRMNNEELPYINQSFWLQAEAPAEASPDDACDRELGERINAHLATLGFSETPSPNRLFPADVWTGWKRLLRGCRDGKKWKDLAPTGSNHAALGAAFLEIYPEYARFPTQ